MKVSCGFFNYLLLTIEVYAKLLNIQSELFINFDSYNDFNYKNAKFKDCRSHIKSTSIRGKSVEQNSRQFDNDNVLSPSK